MNYYAIRENSGRKEPCIAIHPNEAEKYNRNGYGIYWTFNEFKGFGRRKKEDLVAITAFFFEIDKGQKSQMQEKMRSHLAPSLVVETGRGYHLYWYLDKPIDATKDPLEFSAAYRKFLVERMLPVYDGDPQAADACRILRVPFYRYWKDPTREFYITIAYENEAARYSIAEMERAFPSVARIDGTTSGEQTGLFSTNEPGGDFWVRASNLNNLEALRRLSGTAHVSGEKFTFSRDTSGQRIFVNGKPINAWIDREGRIGSVAGGGPTIVNWLHYYHKSYAKVAAILKQVFPELVHETGNQTMASRDARHPRHAR